MAPAAASPGATRATYGTGGGQPTTPGAGATSYPSAPMGSIILLSAATVPLLQP
jgi:hypothetical protein